MQKNLFQVLKSYLLASNPTTTNEMFTFLRGLQVQRQIFFSSAIALNLYLIGIIGINLLLLLTTSSAAAAAPLMMMMNVL